MALTTVDTARWLLVVWTRIWRCTWPRRWTGSVGCWALSSFGPPRRVTGSCWVGWPGSARWCGSGWRAPAAMGPAWPVPEPGRGGGGRATAPTAKSVAAKARPTPWTPSRRPMPPKGAASLGKPNPRRQRGGDPGADGGERSARSTKVTALNQIRHLGFTAPEEIRRSLHGVSREHIAKRAAALRPAAHGDPVIYATKTALRTLGRRVLALDAEKPALDPPLGRAGPRSRPGAAGAARSRSRHRRRPAGHRRRQPGPAALRGGLGPSVRGVAHRGVLGQGHPPPAQPRRRPPSQLSLWGVVITRLRSEPRTQAYMARRLEEGRSKLEIIRVLKRYVAREVYKQLPRT